MIRYEHSAWQDIWYPGDADLIICDPVYSDPDLDYLEAMKGVLRPGGSLYVFSDVSGVAQVKLALDALPGLTFQNWIIWGPNDWGGRSKHRWGQKHDDILFYTRDGYPHHFDGEAVAVPKKMTQRIFNPSGRTTKIPNSVWEDLSGFSTTSRERVKIDGKAAPWQKPIKLIERIVLASSKPGDLIYDPFGGVATVPVVCARLGRRCISSEIDSRVYEAGRERLRKVLKESLDKSPKNLYGSLPQCSDL